MISLQEITGMEGEVITTQEVFTFQRTTVDDDGKVRGRFAFSGVRPRFVDKLKIAGVQINPEVFNPDKFVEI
jgi:pilus assembly protein CpaF